MAHGMKLWLTVTLAGVAIVAAWKLPPSPYAPREAFVRPAETMRARALNEEFRVTSEALRRVLWSDSLAPLAVSSANDGVAFLYPHDGALNEDQIRRFEESMRGEVSEHRGSDMIFAYVLQPNDQNQTDDMGHANRNRTELYVGSVDGQEYCLQVRVHNPRRTARTLANKLSGMDQGVRPFSGAVGTCRPYLHHGMPGPAIQAWMEDGGITLATEHGASTIDISGLGSGVGRRTVFGFAGYGYAINTVNGDRCLAGYADACADLLLNPVTANPALQRDLEVVQMSPASALGTSYNLRSLLLDEEYLFFDLEQEFGSEAFGRFWTSEDDVESAFASAFGMEFGEWVVTWVDRTLGVDEPGPAVSRSSSTGTTLAIALLAGIAFARTRRRQVV